MGSAEEEGLLILNLRNNRFSAVQSKANDPESLASNSLFTNFTDKDGNEWIGSANGISKINKTTLSIKKWEAGELGHANVKSPFVAIKKGADGNFYTTRFGFSQIWKSLITP
jgi:ligand-binding sensor domain-containing protein